MAVGYSTFYCELEDRIVSYHFHHERSQGCINCSQLVFSDERPALFQRWAILGYSSPNISSEGIRSVREVQETNNPPARMSRELRYSDGGRVEVWTKWPGERS